MNTFDDTYVNTIIDLIAQNAGFAIITPATDHTPNALKRLTSPPDELNAKCIKTVFEPGSVTTVVSQHNESSPEEMDKQKSHKHFYNYIKSPHNHHKIFSIVILY